MHSQRGAGRKKSRTVRGRLVSTERSGPLPRAEVVRRPRKTPDNTIRAKNMVNKGIAPVVPMTPAVAPMALAA